MSAYTGIEMAGQGDYLYRRKGSPYWRLKFQYPNEHMRADVAFALGRAVKAVEDVSLRTASKREAEVLAGQKIHEHRKAMLVHQALRDPTKSWGRLIQRFEMEPGKVVNNPDGSQTVATENEIIDIRDGVMVSRPNLKGFDVELEESVLGPEVSRTIIDGDVANKKARYKDVDAEIVENYITRNRKSDEDAKLVRDMYAVFKKVSGKTFASAGRQDAEAFVTYQLTRGGKDGTGVSHGRVMRQVALLRAAINVELEKSDKPRLQRNIFDHVDIPDDEEPKTREAYTEADMASVRLRLHEFEPDERLLWVWHASTGIRPSEIHSITFEDLEEATDPNDIDHETGKPRVHSTRYISIDKGKNSYSPRALPIPQSVLDLKLEDGTTMLPYPINGPMFKRSVRRLCDAINHKLQNWGINTPQNGKVFYCCRHRVPRRLMECGVQDEQMSRAIMGHTRRIEPHDRYGRRRGYGHRYTMWSLKPILDKIGY